MGKELIEKVFQKFEDHLNVENNNRIVFSGKFGIGKSYFLNEFFKDERYDKEYFPIYLNPVNYSIASNEDIFELIKFDILFQILSRDVIVFEKLNFPKGNLIHQYFTNKFLEDFISNADLIGESIVENSASGSYGILKNVGKLIDKLSQLSLRDFKNFEDEIKKNSELEIINNFFKKHEGKIGSFYENNAITQLIYELIKNIEDQTNKKMTLVIDDLDRIDPEHIFRILNIFSAHDKLGENKFGFEKVILVCDINNIKHIYHHFYGDNVDFFGYINKFYSSEVYKYSNADYVNWFNANFPQNQYDAENIQFLRYIFSDAIMKNYISARQLFNNDFSRLGISNFYTKNVEQKFTVISNNQSVRIFSLFQPIYSLLKTVIRYFGSSNNFLKYINDIEFQQLSRFQNILGTMYLFINLRRDINEVGNQTFSTPYNFTITYDGYNKYEFQGDFKKADLKLFFKDVLNQYNQIIEIY
ncbi:P-loop NTPase fold protein [uncultured Chryseobacterium sp.]|uniref:P-loop NTPase fold protein n=1 Tax=uncultured Chryseobacterium sp. TaxID=259322 RepID=UPI0025F327C3|nr:P-loop NTPase fold protein [uncultured Chryseobacterium sp.]